jgi:RND family efflux transporter MFP subunit
MRRKTLISVTVLLIGACLSGCAAKRSEANANSTSQPRTPVEPALSVSTAPVIEREAARSVEVVGSLDAEDEVTVSSQASGNLDEISVDLGSPVRRGQTIAKLDQRELAWKAEQADAAVKQAEARLGVKSGEKIDPEKQPDVRQAKSAMERARYDLNASKELAQQGDISQQQRDVYQRTFDQAEARYQAALENVRNLEAVLEEKRASLGLARKQLSDATITSPINGIVKAKLASKGEYLQPGKPIVTIVQINPLRLRLEVPEAFAAAIKVGQPVTLRVDTFADRTFNGQIKRINPSIDEKNRSLTVEGQVPNDAGMLKPGMFARAQIVSDARGKALLVPEKAIVSLAGVNKVFVLEGGKAVEKQVKLGAKDGSMVEILGGVNAGDRVITSNTEQLHDGMSVQ